MVSSRQLLARATGPQKIFGRFYSNVAALQMYRNEVNIIKRNATDSDRYQKPAWSDLLTEDVEPQAYGERLFERLVDGLTQEHLQTERMVLRHYEWLVPDENTTPTQIAIYDALYHRAITVSNDQLSKILALEESTIMSPPSKEGHSFYFRAWEFKIIQLEELIEYWRQDEIHHAEVNEWQRTIDHCKRRGLTQDYVVTIRYWGTVEGPKRPIDRHLADVKERNSGILGEFLNHVEAWFPEIAAHAKVFLLPDAHHSGGQLNQLFAEDTERLLIALGHYPSSLNRQRGGQYSSFLPSSGDADLFRGLKTDFWNNFRSMAAVAPDEMVAQLDTHFNATQVYANDNPAESGTCRHEFTDGLRNMFKTQATPHQYSSYTIVVFIGKDITLDNFMSESSFLEGGSRAGVLTKDILLRIIGAEAQANDRSASVQAFNSQMSAFCFVDLWPWLWHKNIEQAIWILCQYLRIVRPLICASYSRIVNGIVRSDFQHENGVGMGAFTPLVAEATIQFYNDPQNDDETRENSAFINIPHIHPGRDKYGPQDIKLRRVFELTMYYTFLISHVATDVVDKHYKDSEQPTRLEICTEILDEVNKLKSKEPHRAFFKALKKAKAELVTHLTEGAGVRSAGAGYAAMADDVRPILNNAGSLKLARLGQAEGAPNSKDRLTQLESFWQMNMPDLHIAIPHLDENKNEWIQSLANLQLGQFFYLAVIGQAEPDEYTNQILSTFPPPWAQNGDDTWLNSKSERKNATLTAGLWLQQRPNAGKKLRRAFPQSFAPASEQQGRPIGLLATSGYGHIRLLTADGQKQTFRIQCKAAIPTSHLEMRALDFNELGINIVDSQGNVFRTQLAGTKMSAASIPWQAFQTNEDLRSLWQEICTMNSITIPVDAVPQQATRDWGSKGVAALTDKAKKEAPFQNKPPAEEDANHILVSFLDQRFPNGGNFQTISQSDYPKSTGDQDAFAEFLRQPHLVGHPYLEFWKSKFHIEKPTIAVLNKNIPIYRSCTKYVHNLISISRVNAQGKKLAVQDTILTIGPPGSALKDPFAEGSGQSCLTGKPSKKGEDDDGGEDGNGKPGPSKAAKKPSSRRRATEEEKEAETEPPPKKSGSKRRAAAEVAQDDEMTAPPSKKQRTIEQDDQAPQKRRTIVQNDDIDMDEPEEEQPKMSKLKRVKTTPTAGYRKSSSSKPN